MVEIVLMALVIYGLYTFQFLHLRQDDGQQPCLLQQPETNRWLFG
jgi:hypothetical protein